MNIKRSFFYSKVILFFIGVLQYFTTVINCSRDEFSYFLRNAGESTIKNDKIFYKVENKNDTNIVHKALHYKEKKNQSWKLNESADQRYPDAIIIGAKKCGTRALLEFLRLNPRVCAPGPEVHFFDKNFDKGFDWYRYVLKFKFIAFVFKKLFAKFFIY